VDCFDALASERPYRKAMPLDEAMAFVKGRAGIQFDPQIVELLDKNFLVPGREGAPADWRRLNRSRRT
jgi:HD-GYP domain-containing protein (c-di-GMP phosphodiesterase class II)